MSGIPRKGVIKDEGVQSGIPDFQLALDGLFVGITPSQRNQHLKKRINISIYRILTPPSHRLYFLSVFWVCACEINKNDVMNSLTSYFSKPSFTVEK